MRSFRSGIQQTALPVFLFVGALNLPAPNVKTMTVPAASVHLDSSKAASRRLVSRMEEPSDLVCEDACRAVNHFLKSRCPGKT